METKQPLADRMHQKCNSTVHYISGSTFFVESAIKKYFKQLCCHLWETGSGFQNTKSAQNHFSAPKSLNFYQIIPCKGQSWGVLITSAKSLSRRWYNYHLSTQLLLLYSFMGISDLLALWKPKLALRNCNLRIPYLDR